MYPLTIKAAYLRVVHSNAVLFDVSVGFHPCVKLGIFLDVEENRLLRLLRDIQQHAHAHQGHEQRRSPVGNKR